MAKVKSQSEKRNRTLGAGTPSKPEPVRSAVICAFCRGTGRDPFGALSAVSNCQVCGGRGEIQVRGPVVACAFCRGTGMPPSNTDRLHCLACKGTGVVPEIKNPVECPACEGTGHQLMRTTRGKRPIRQRCLKCNGQRLIPKERAERLSKTKKRGMAQCAFCRGTGIQPANTDNLSCLACGGTGEVPAVKNTVKCPDCDGDGRHTLRTFRGRRYMRQHCLKCKGQGVVRLSVDKT